MRPALAAHPEVQLMYRATDLQLGGAQTAKPDLPSVGGTLVEVAPMAGRFVSTVMLAHTRVSVISELPPSQQVGESVDVIFPAQPRVVFDSTGYRVEQD
jgi:hypothetical protein